MRDRYKILDKEGGLLCYFHYHRMATRIYKPKAGKPEFGNEREELILEVDAEYRIVQNITVGELRITGGNGGNSDYAPFL